MKNFLFALSDDDDSFRPVCYTAQFDEPAEGLTIRFSDGSWSLENDFSDWEDDEE